MKPTFKQLSLVIIIQLLSLAFGFFMFKNIYPSIPFPFGACILVYILAFSYAMVRYALLKLFPIHRTTKNIDMHDIMGSLPLFTLFGIMLYVLSTAYIAFQYSFLACMAWLIAFTVVTSLIERYIVPKLPKFKKVQ